MKNYAQPFRNWFRSVEKPHFFEWAVLGLLVLIALVCFRFPDICSTADNSILLLRSIKEGYFLDFYSYTVKYANTSWPANYELMIYIIFAIWELPVAIINGIHSFDYTTSFVAILWSKLLILGSVLICAFFVYRIIILLTQEKNKAKWGIFLFLSSSFAFFPAFVTGQYDSIALVFTLGGVYFFLKGNRKWFMILFAISIPLKLFSLFLYIPLLLLYEKRITRIGFYSILIMIPYTLQKLLFRHDIAYNYLVSSQSKDVKNNLLGFNLKIGDTELVVFIMTFIVICLICYLATYSKELAYKYVPYICFATYSALFLGIRFSPHWIIVLSPFIVITMIQNQRFLKVNLLLETIVFGCSFFFNAIIFNMVYSRPTTDYMLLDKLDIISPYKKCKFYSLKEFIEFYSLDSYKSIIVTVFITALIALLVLLYPALQKKNEGKLERSIVWFRVTPTILMLILTIYISVASTNPVLFNTFDNKNATTSVLSKFDLLEDNTLIQEFTFKSNYKLSYIKTRFNLVGSSRSDQSTITCSIIDQNTTKKIFQKVIGTSSLISDQDYLIKLNHLPVIKGHTYRICFSGKKEKGENQCYLYQSSSPDKKYPVYYNQTPAENNLLLMIR